MEYIYAKDLKKNYEVWGHFYNVLLDDGKTINCRSTLEIYSKGIGITSSNLPDAIFIMMNPGSSEPLNGSNDPRVYTIASSQITTLESILIPTKPDRTQYQVMRLMKHFNWKHVRVLNLSDLRNSSSKVFYQEYLNIGFAGQSIFNKSRRNELHKNMPTDNKMKVVCAWGLNDALSDLATQCINSLTALSVAVSNFSEDIQKLKYRHPLPRNHQAQVDWLEKTIQQLQKNK